MDVWRDRLGRSLVSTWADPFFRVLNSGAPMGLQILGQLGGPNFRDQSGPLGKEGFPCSMTLVLRLNIKKYINIDKT